MTNRKTVLLTFDLEEFDMPIEYGNTISFHDQIKTSLDGTLAILDLLDKHKIKATFFCTYTFAESAHSTISELCKANHELASHGCYHSKFEESHLSQSKKGLEDFFGKEIFGFRMPRMKPVDYRKLSESGYLYDSSLNPIFLPGRYNNLSKPRTLYQLGQLWEMPASTTPILRLPLFWLTFHHLPLWAYKTICKQAFAPANYINLYFHPWEFVDLKRKFGLPNFLTKNTGQLMIERMEELIEWMILQGCSFTTVYDFIKSIPINSLPSSNSR